MRKNMCFFHLVVLCVCVRFFFGGVLGGSSIWTNNYAVCLKINQPPKGLAYLLFPRKTNRTEFRNPPPTPKKTYLQLLAPCPNDFLRKRFPFWWSKSGRGSVFPAQWGPTTKSPGPRAMSGRQLWAPMAPSSARDRCQRRQAPQALSLGERSQAGESEHRPHSFAIKVTPVVYWEATPNF